MKSARTGGAQSGDQPLEFLANPKWIRVLAGGEILADSRRSILLREPGKPPTYYFPQDDIRMARLRPSEHRTYSPPRGRASYWHVEVRDGLLENAAWSYSGTREEAPELEAYIAFDWDKMDAWFEEDEQVYAHPRDPYHRVDALRSSRRVQVMIGGETVAESHRPVLVFETGLPVRYYLPLLDIRTELLRPSRRLSRCPYKGEASYFSLEVAGGSYPDLFWTYRFPTPALGAITGMVSFYQERVGLLRVDGAAEPAD